MYIPKKAWQKYEKLIQNNLVTNSKNETVYKLGDDKWMKDIYRLAELMLKDSMEIAIKYPIEGFKAAFIVEEITGEVDYINSIYYLFHRHNGYLSMIKSYSKSIYEFRNEMINSVLYSKISESRKSQLEALGVSSTLQFINNIESDENDTW